MWVVTPKRMDVVCSILSHEWVRLGLGSGSGTLQEIYLEETEGDEKYLVRNCNSPHFKRSTNEWTKKIRRNGIARVPKLSCEDLARHPNRFAVKVKIRCTSFEIVMTGGRLREESCVDTLVGAPLVSRSCFPALIA